jgi:acetyl esterase
MKKLIVSLISCSFFILHFAIITGQTLTSGAKTGDEVIHIQQVYKTIDTFKLKVDIFYTNQSFKKENNTAIVFFHGGGWAFGTPSEFFTTCERYAKMGIVAFSVDYRLSIDKGVIPSKTISPIEFVMD